MKVELTEEDITSLRMLGKTITKVLKMVDGAEEGKQKKPSNPLTDKVMSPRQLKEHFKKQFK